MARGRAKDDWYLYVSVLRVLKPVSSAESSAVNVKKRWQVLSWIKVVWSFLVAVAVSSLSKIVHVELYEVSW